MLLLVWKQFQEDGAVTANARLARSGVALAHCILKSDDIIRMNGG